MAKVVKLKDRRANPILPLTRSTLVEMNNGDSVQMAYDGINLTHYTKDEINDAGYTTNTGTITGITMNGASKGTSGVVDLGTVVISETDPIYSASAAAGITSSDITNWNSKTDNVGTITGITMNGTSKGTSGVVDLGTVLTEHQSLSSYATSANYDSSTKKIYLKNGTTTLSEIDATDFIKDGMVDTAYVQGANLVISFNTDAGKEAVNVPISDIFNANNYYTKTEINNAGYLTSFTETDPTVPSHVKSISSTNITNWNTAHTNSHTHSNKTVLDGIKATDIDNWNSKTSNTGTITGITMNNTSKGTSGVVDLGTVVTSETDPVFTASAAHGITSSDISNWNSKTDNVGTITGITMNGESKGTSGVVDLGNVITSHQSLANYVTKSELNSASYLQSFTETDPIYSASAAAGITSSDITNWNNKLSSFTETDPTVPSHVKTIKQTDITNWNSKTDNVGTITGINMNGASKGTSGVVNLGTVITSETQLSKGTTTGSGNAVTDISVSNHQITLTKGKTFLESFTETDPIYSASAAAGITASDISNWNSKTDNVGTITGITMNGASKGTSGVVDLGTVLTEHQSLSSYATSANYDSSAKKIYLKHDTTVLSEIDATDFIKDGMVDTAYVQGSNLVISFNTDAGKEAVNVPIANIFNASNYYTKTEIDNAAYLQSETDPVYSASAAAGITASDITNWNSKTNNTGTITGITMNGVSKGTAGVVDLGTVVTSETDPIYSASAAAGITSSDITNWNNKTSNTGTITGITMNGASKGTSGVVDLGTVITSETQLSKGTTTGSGNAVTDISVSNHQITLTKGSTFLTSETDPIYSASAAAGITSTDITNWNSKTDNVGTITGITMNGSSKGTSGVVNLGTVITSETQLSKGTTSGSGNAVTDISVSNHQITLTKGSTFLTAHQNIKTINNNTLVGTGNVTINELPTVSSTDNGKVLQVVNGTWTLVSPVTLYSGSGTPSNAQGNNGDLYMQI